MRELHGKLASTSKQLELSREEVERLRLEDAAQMRSFVHKQTKQMKQNVLQCLDRAGECSLSEGEAAGGLPGWGDPGSAHGGEM